MAHAPNHNEPARRRSLIVITACLVACAVGVAATMVIEADDPASAADDTTTILPLYSGEQIVISDAGDIVAGTDAGIIQSQCLELDIRFCIGTENQGPPIQVSGIDRSPNAGWDGAIGWLVDEAEDVLAPLYDVPDDGRIAAYAQADVHAYVHARLRQIIDKAAWEQPLTVDEQRALAYLQDSLIDDETRRARAAWNEYVRFENSPCTYRPPAAPAYVTEPIVVPESVRTQCNRATASMLAELFTPVPPIPPVEAFRAWGSYAISEERALPANSELELIARMEAAAAAGFVFAGLAAVGVAAGAAALVAASSATVATTAVLLIGSKTALWGASGIAAGALLGPIGIAAAASVVGIVIFALVVLGLLLAQAIERAQVGKTLSADKEAAKDRLDPLGIADIRSTYGDRDFLDYGDDIPYHHDEQFSALLLEFVVEGATLRNDGSLTEIPSGLWAPNATGTDDHRFRLVSGPDAGSIVDSIHIEQDDDDFDLRFDQGWMIVSPEGSATVPSLSFRYDDPSGQRWSVIRSPSSDDYPNGGFVLSPIDDDGMTADGAFSETLTFFDGADEITVALAPPGTLEPGAVYPAAVGSLVTGTSVGLRPNPVDDGGAFDPEAFTTGYDFVWTVERYDETAGAWVGVHGDTSYSTAFVPMIVGRYRATVTMQEAVGSPAPAVTGEVAFAIAAPTIEVDSIVLVDNGFDTAYLDVRLGEAVPSDQFTIDVEWPGGFDGGPGPVTQASVPCQGIPGPHLCNGAADGEVGGPLSLAITPLTDLSRDVTVTITNQAGGTVTRAVAFESSERPTLRATDPVDDLVEFTSGEIHVQRVVGVGTPTQIAIVEPGDLIDGQPVALGLYDTEAGNSVTSFDPLGFPGPRVSLTQDVDDEWVLSVGGIAEFDQIGTVTVPIVVQQNDPSGLGRTVRLLQLDVVAAPDDQFRGLVEHDLPATGGETESVPPLTPFLIGGAAGATFTGDVCVNLYRTALPPGPERCGPSTDFFTADGDGLVFPAWELVPGGVRAGSNHRAEIRLIDDGSRVASGLSYDVLFRVPNEPPTVDVLAWNDAASELTYAASPSDAGIALTDVVCELDGAPYAECATPGGDVFDLSSLDNGSHSFEIRVHDDRNNFTTRALSFGVTNGVPPSTTTTTTTTTTDPAPTTTTEPEPSPTSTSTTTSTTSTTSTTPSDPTTTTSTTPGGIATSTTSTTMIGGSTTSAPTDSVPGSAPFRFVGNAVPDAVVDIVVTSPSIDQGRRYRGVLRSTPVEVGPALATSDGTVTFTDVTLPSDWSDGQHSFTLIDASSDVTTSVVVFEVSSGSVEVVSVTDGPSAELPSTGGDAAPLRNLATLLLVLGLVLFSVTARRRERGVSVD
ncbi:hypothetical protein BDK89_1565 [Ilumatobacter fluminis]|uniref:Uncharacterized protein n=1 Tax=Ilumatobacter fluminis TaxID=467091 RepID=A0A4R7I0L5_9ACTN|nr:hypothetical protein [Ilumatobacter fluminis]TDT15983.1 hypothetical protein BDK89_1565 [Ilumatobacter fluminis]